MRFAPKIMGILNVTPDSFSGDGLMKNAEHVAAALAQAEKMGAEGADMLDVGGESTRPGALPVAAEEELRRVIPVISAVRGKFPDMPIGIDTMKPVVARAALEAGATILNDVSGARMHEGMFALAVRHKARLVLMHNAAYSGAKNSAVIGGEYNAPPRADIVEETLNELDNLAKRAQKAGVARENIILDPGLGFGKTVEQNLALVREIGALRKLGFPILIAASRKSFIGRTLNAPPEDRLEGTAAVTAVASFLGADILRVHDVRFMARVARMAAALADEGD